MLKKLTIINAFLLVYIIPVFAETAKRIDPGTAIAKGIGALFIFVIIAIAIGLGFIYILYKIIFRIWFKEKERYEKRTQSNPSNQNKPNKEPEFIDFRKKR